MTSFLGLSGDTLEKWFKDLFEKEFQFDTYFPGSKQIPLSALNPEQSHEEHLELDAFLLIGKTCIILEYTSESSGFKDKIKKFLRNSKIFIESQISNKDKFELCGISGEVLYDFEEITDWRLAFFCTHDNFESSRTGISDFPEFPSLQPQLSLFRPTQINYFCQLSQLINKHSRNEFLASVSIAITEEEANIKLSYIKTSGKFVNADKREKADVFVVKFKVGTLLKMARVSRHEGIPFILDDDNDSKYQRLLIQRKLSNISEGFISDNSRMAFPNTLTLIANSDCKDLEEETKIEFPMKYGSLEVIDGQHRLYAYTHTSISNTTREESEVLATVIKFRTNDKKKISRYSAKVFCDINANQAKVKNSLIYLIKYDVLGDKDFKAIAGKILLECDKSYRKALSKMLMTNTLRKTTPLSTIPVQITTIADNDLVPFLKGIKIDKSAITEDEFIRIFGNNRDYFRRHKGAFWKKGKELIETYFNSIKGVFPEDWKKGSNSILHSSKYYSALIRWYRYMLFDEAKELSEIRNELVSLKSAVDGITKPINSASFPISSDLLPAKNKGIGTMFEFLKNPQAQTS